MTNRHALQTLFQVKPRQLFSLLLLMLGSSFGEGISLLLLIPLLHYTGITPSTHASAHSGWLQRLIPQHMSLSTVLLIYAAIVIGFACWNYAKSRYSARLQQHLIRRCRQNLYHATCHASWSFLSQQTPSHINHMLTTEIQRISSALQQGLMLTANIFVCLTYLFVALYLSWPITLIALVSCSLLLLTTRHHTAYAKKNGRQAFGFYRSLHQKLEQTLQGLKQAKLWQSESRYCSDLNQCSQTLQQTQIQFANSQAATQWLFTTGGAVMICLLFYLSSVKLHIATSHILVLIVTFARILPKTAGAQRSVQIIINNLSGLHALVGFYQQCQQATHRVNTTNSFSSPTHDIKLQALSFCHSGSNQPTLLNLSLSIPAGQTTAITGPSGCGKSTLLDCITGLLTPQSGHIIIDGTTLNDNNRTSWLKQVAYVSQDPFLLHASIRDNLLWVKPNASELDMWQALEKAQAFNFIKQLPQQLDTLVGHRGLQISGGERQRIVLAQAILRNASVLILDEATSQLDHRHEQLIQHTLQQLHGSMTIIVVAHRETSLATADHIIRLKPIKSTDFSATTHASAVSV